MADIIAMTDDEGGAAGWWLGVGGTTTASGRERGVMVAPLVDAVSTLFSADCDVGEAGWRMWRTCWTDMQPTVERERTAAASAFRQTRISRHQH